MSSIEPRLIAKARGSQLPTGSSAGATNTTLFATDHEAPFELLVRNAMRALYRNRWLLLWTILVVTVVSLVLVRALPPTYTAEARVLVRTESIGSPAYLSGVASVGSGLGAETPERQLETEMQLATSRGVVEKAVRETHTTYDQAFQSPLTHILAPAIDAYAWIKEHWMGMPHFDRKNETNTVDAVAKSVSVSLVRSKGAEVSSNLILFTLPATDPAVAQTLLSSIVQNYLTLQSDLSEKTATEALASVQREAARATAETDSVRGRLQNFLARGAVGSAAAAEAEPGANGQELDRLRTSLFSAETDLRDARNRFLENADTVVRLVQRVQFINTRISEVVRRNVREGTGADVLRQQLRAAELRQAELKRRADQIELALRSAPTAMNNRVLIDPPLRPLTSDWKKRAAYIVLGFIAGLCLGIFLLVLREILSNSVRSADDVRQSFGMSPAALIPQTGALGSGSAGASRRSVLDAAANRLAARLQREADSLYSFDQGHRVDSLLVMVTGTHAGAGTTTVARALSAALASMPASTSALADTSVLVAAALAERVRNRTVNFAHFETEALHRNATLQSPPGHAQVSGDVVRLISESPTAKRTAMIEPSTAHPTTASGMMQYRWTVVDASAIEIDVAELANTAADLRVLVLDASRTGRQSVRDALTDLAASGSSEPLLVLNRVEKQPPAFLLNRW